MMETRERVLQLLQEGKSKANIARDLGVSKPAITKHVKNLVDQGRWTEEDGGNRKTKERASSKAEATKPKSNGGRRPPPGPNRGSFKEGNSGGPGPPPGNDNATKTGEHRNPLLHSVRAERAALVAITEDDSPADLMRRSIEVHQLAIADMTQEIEAILASRQRWWWLGSTYTRQEGDAELMGTGRISQRRRQPREEAAKAMMEARARVQGKLDSAIAKLHTMLNDADGKRKRGLADLLAAMRQGGEDE